MSKHKKTSEKILNQPLEMTMKSFKKPGMFKEIWRRFKKNTSAVVGLVLLITMILTCVIGAWIIPYDRVIHQDSSIRRLSPCSEYIAGTDDYGRDIFARLIYGGRTTISIGLIAAFCSLAIGGTIGLIAGYYSKLDNLIMRVIDIVAAVPPILLALATVAALGTNIVNIVIAITLARIPAYVRVIRAASLTVVNNEYIEACRAGGANDIHIILKHVVPNCLGTIIIQTTMSMSALILQAASLSYLGLGVQPPNPEWGTMLSEGRGVMLYAPHLMIFPGLCIVLVTLALNLIGDGLRDAFDPKLKT